MVHILNKTKLTVTVSSLQKLSEMQH